MRMAMLLVLVFATCGTAVSQPASPESRLRDQIVAAEASASKLWTEGKALGAFGPGTLWSEVDSKEHRCAILALLLGKEEFVGGVEPLASQPLERTHDQYAEMLQVYSLSFSNFVHIAEFALEEPFDERVIGWNLSCVGSFEIPNEAAILGPESRAKLKVDGNFLIVLGDIEDGFAEEFARVIAANPRIHTVALTSGGGGMTEAIRAGYMIRAMRLNTRLYGNCFSACVLLFLGGVERQLWSPYPELGFHQASLSGRSISPGSDAYELIGTYVEKMGANRRFVLASMFAARPEDMHFSDVYALCDNNVVTWVQRLC